MHSNYIQLEMELGALISSDKESISGMYSSRRSQNQERVGCSSCATYFPTRIGKNAQRNVAGVKFNNLLLHISLHQDSQVITSSMLASGSYMHDLRSQ